MPNLKLGSIPKSNRFEWTGLNGRINYPTQVIIKMARWNIFKSCVGAIHICGVATLIVIGLNHGQCSYWTAKSSSIKKSMVKCTSQKYLGTHFHCPHIFRRAFDLQKKYHWLIVHKINRGFSFMKEIVKSSKSVAASDT